eukprot:CAMPEP_0183325196 /NCGR_PEP_ID=MMETSP0160_2-20130417/78961_1 /TAXON_ID=2839 ORGANISM="Odontella Sinensis, Strain Grunow 1884" /NCGR_SAMPLE_ID=MMETSP0160_2 /ASSEMBLY_ACC=CAM_ASM_000250 /LENGTH=77 /DNA_ID=CAMNT_0025492939 /DNA_START=755 /DNA_END=985 /DNA_ORIENTATION=+
MTPIAYGTNDQKIMNPLLTSVGVPWPTRGPGGVFTPETLMWKPLATFRPQADGTQSTPKSPLMGSGKSAQDLVSSGP